MIAALCYFLQDVRLKLARHQERDQSEYAVIAACMKPDLHLNIRPAPDYRDTPTSTLSYCPR